MKSVVPYIELSIECQLQSTNPREREQLIIKGFRFQMLHKYFTQPN